jgi:hypothetical protein
MHKETRSLNILEINAEQDTRDTETVKEADTDIDRSRREEPMMLVRIVLRFRRRVCTPLHCELSSTAHPNGRARDRIGRVGWVARLDSAVQSTAWVTVHELCIHPHQWSHP